MTILHLSRPDYLECGERARLIPVAPDSRKETKLTSAFLATFTMVPDYARQLLEGIGFRLGKTSQLECCTEVVFKGMKDKKLRPDGLIIVTTGKKVWRALIEAKVGGAELTKEQIENYLDLAKQFNVDAVISISNQFTALPTHHPVTIAKSKYKTIGLYHWSWTYLMAEAVMWVKSHKITDCEQSYLLEELVRYLSHASSGVLSIDRMNKEWKDICGAVQTEAPLHKASTEVMQTVSTWHQFSRNIALKLSIAVERTVTLNLKKPHRENAELRLQDDCQHLAQSKQLEAVFDVPNAAAHIKLIADIQKRTIKASMSIKAPEDKPTAKGRINWLLRQLNKANSPQLIIKTYWPGRAIETLAHLAVIREKGIEILIPESHRSLTPTGFEIAMIKDLAGRFRGGQTFVQDTEPFVAEFYKEVGQNLREWTASPPKIEAPQPNDHIPPRLDIEIPEAAIAIEEEQNSNVVATLLNTQTGA